MKLEKLQVTRQMFGKFLLFKVGEMTASEGLTCTNASQSHVLVAKEPAPGDNCQMSVAVTVHGELFLIHILHEVLGSKTEWNSTLYMCRVTAIRKCLGQIVAIYCCEFWTDCPRFSNKLEDLATK